ncbi:MAG: hypothetical protein KDA58_03315 [Planctomycetaceae bacterium]|nr:hypothetical protein [Planctomycetaceae bacterium]
MLTPGLGSLDFRELTSLPARTLVAPLHVIREIRVALGAVNFNLQVGTEETVYVSSDLFTAFNTWDAQREQDDNWN